MQNALDTAARAIGLNEGDKRAALQDYLTTGGASLDPATTAWCAAFVGATLKQSGYEGTGSNMARSYLDWGQPVDQPQRGDIAVFSRGDPNGPFGHVGFFEGYNPDGTIRVLGGNQGDAVSVAGYDPSRLLGFRRAEGAAPQNAFAMPGQQQPPNQNALAQRPTLADFGVNFAPTEYTNRLRPMDRAALQPINVGATYGA
jgi:uncharacterized protein (TIGR02594 family)